MDGKHTEKGAKMGWKERIW